jgi:hypothetical protein
MSKFLPNEDEILVVEVEKERAIYDSFLEKHKDYGYLTRRWSRGERFSHYDIISVTTVCYIGLLPISCAIPYQIQII